ncbi:cyclic nucleotide-gated cation channel-like isoform X2 [Pollicipes pollicipes]|nr:cyclic nucleotide-gated cation channel-like isoform X2 [Pollicipes pollicipes]
MEVFEAIYSDQLRSITIFEQAPDYLIRRLSCMCEQQVFLPGDFITKRGDIGQKVYIIRRGSVVVYHTAPSAPDYFLYSGSIYGDVQMVFPTIPYEHNLVADDPSDVLVINQPEIQQLLTDDPQFYFKVRRYIQMKYADVIQDRKPTMTHNV